MVCKQYTRDSLETKQWMGNNDQTITLQANIAFFCYSSVIWGGQRRNSKIASIWTLYKKRHHVGVKRGCSPSWRWSTCPDPRRLGWGESLHWIPRWSWWSGLRQIAWPAGLWWTEGGEENTQSLVVLNLHKEIIKIRWSVFDTGDQFSTLYVVIGFFFVCALQ